MTMYDVRIPEGQRRLQQLAYASGVVAVFRQDVGTSDALCTVAWQRTIADERVLGQEAAALWETAFLRGYHDARLRRAYPQTLTAPIECVCQDRVLSLAHGASTQDMCQCN